MYDHVNFYNPFSFNFLHQGGYVSSDASLLTCVCLLVGLHRNYLTDLHDVGLLSSLDDILEVIWTWFKNFGRGTSRILKTTPSSLPNGKIMMKYNPIQNTADKDISVSCE